MSAWVKLVKGELEWHSAVPMVFTFLYPPEMNGKIKVDEDMDDFVMIYDDVEFNWKILLGDIKNVPKIEKILKKTGYMTCGNFNFNDKVAEGEVSFYDIRVKI